MLNSLQLILLCLVLVFFSTDIRVSGMLSLDPNARPTFQLFEFFAAPLVLIWVYKLAVRQSTITLTNKANLFFGLFVLWATVISFLANDPFHALSRAKDFFLAWILFVSFRDLNAQQLEKLMKSSLLLAAFWSIFGIMQMYELDPWFGSKLGALFKIGVSWKTVVDPISGELKDSAFAQGIYLYPQDFSYYLLMPLFLSSWLVSKNKAWFILFFIVLLALIGSGSKTFYLLALIFVFWKVMRMFGVGKWPTAAAGFIFLMMSILGGMIFLRPERFLRAIGTFIWRTEQWTDTVGMLMERHYILLSGHGTEYLEQTYSRFHYPNPHNAILYFLIEYGLIGLLLFAGFLYFVLRQDQLRSDRGSSTKSNAICKSWHAGSDKFIFSGLLFTLSMTIVDDYFVQTQLTAIFMFYLGMFNRLNTVQVK